MVTSPSSVIVDHRVAAGPSHRHRHFLQLLSTKSYTRFLPPSHDDDTHIITPL
jgi:hypothetical protein